MHAMDVAGEADAFLASLEAEVKQERADANGSTPATEAGAVCFVQPSHIIVDIHG